MDKDRFRRDMGGVEEAYREVARRLGVLEESEQQRASLRAVTPGSPPRKPSTKKK